MSLINLVPSLKWKINTTVYEVLRKVDFFSSCPVDRRHNIYYNGIVLRCS